MDYKELIRHSNKGDQQAIKALLRYAKSLNEENKLLECWIEKISLSLRPLPRTVEGMKKRFIFITVDYDIYHESDAGGRLWPLTSILDSILDEIYGIDSAKDSIDQYAGATTPSRLAYVMEDYFGIGDSVFKNSLQDIKVRIWADLLADEVERRFHASKKDQIGGA